MKKIINQVDHMVDEMCQGMVKAHPNQIQYFAQYKVITRQEMKQNQVALISGGGSGHEPAHAGYVGYGMLDAAVCGDIFASPSSIQIYHAINQVATDQGVLLIVKNYSGDCMNFDTAAEMAEDDGINVKAVYVNDDIAVKDSLYTIGRRGVAGTVLVEKIAGASAERGDQLEEVYRLAQKTVDHVKSIGFALNSCTVPAKGTPTFELGDNEIEFGVGIHGEPGIERRTMQSAKALANDMLDQLVAELSLVTGDEVIVLINGLGGTPLHELYILSNEVHHYLNHLGVKIEDTIVGNYMTSIDMAGASISLLKTDEEIKTLYNFPVKTIALNK